MIRKNNLSGNSKLFFPYFLHGKNIAEEQNLSEKNSDKHKEDLQEISRLIVKINEKNPSGDAPQKVRLSDNLKAHDARVPFDCNKATGNGDIQKLQKLIMQTFATISSANDREKSRLRFVVKDNNTSCKKDAEDENLQILKESIRELTGRISSVRKGHKKSLNDNIKNSISTFNLYPCKTAVEYLKKANLRPSAKESLANDWDKVGSDMWISVAKILTEEKLV
jgi:hypothetical protein